MKASNAIIENKESITSFEKKTLKYVFLIAILGYLIFTNLSNADGNGNKRAASKAYEDDDPSVLSFLFSFAMLRECSGELLMLFGSVGGYMIMAKINNWLDKVEEEQRRHATETEDDDGQGSGNEGEKEGADEGREQATLNKKDQ